VSEVVSSILPRAKKQKRESSKFGEGFAGEKGTGSHKLEMIRGED